MSNKIHISYNTLVVDIPTMSLDELSTKYNISDVTLCKRIKEHGLYSLYRDTRRAVIELKTKQRYVRLSSDLGITKEQLQADVNAGMLVPHLRAKYNLTIREVQQLLQIFNITPMKMQDSPLYMKNLSNASRKIWDSQEQRVKHGQVMRDKFVDPTFKAAHDARYRTKEHREKKRKSSLARWESVEFREQQAIMRSKMFQNPTQPHRKICEILKSLNIEYVEEYPIGEYRFDIFLPKLNILIEVQGDRWHDPYSQNVEIKRNVARDRAKNTYIKEYFPNYTLHYVHEHECMTHGYAEAKVKHIVGVEQMSLVDFDFRDLQIGTPDKKEANQFLYSWHYLLDNRGGIDIGAFYQDKLIAIARFSTTVRLEVATSLGLKSTQVFELSRFCIHPAYQKKNLASWFLARCEKLIGWLKPTITHLVSFADTTVGHAGTIYKASNWKYVSSTRPDYTYARTNEDGHEYGMGKKTLYDKARKLGMKEREYAERFGFHKVWGQQKHKFVKQLKT